MKKQVEEWLALADKDLLAAEELRNNLLLSNVVSFHCQQAIEKYFKAFISHNNLEIKKIHDLIKLYGTVKETINLDINEDTLAIVNETYIETRYPGELGLLPGGMPTEKHISLFLELAHRIKSKISQSIL